jgi:hypothetical protein
MGKLLMGRALTQRRSALAAELFCAFNRSAAGVTGEGKCVTALRAELPPLAVLRAATRTEHSPPFSHAKYGSQKRCVPLAMNRRAQR